METELWPTLGGLEMNPDVDVSSNLLGMKSSAGLPNFSHEKNKDSTRASSASGCVFFCVTELY